MSGFAAGFATLLLPAFLGYLGRRLNLISKGAESDLNKLAFYFAMPAMVFSNLVRSNLAALFGPQFLVQLFVILVGMAIFLIGNRLLPGTPERGGPLVITAMTAFYANFANIGMPVAVAVFGDPSVMVPFMLLQQLVFMPIALAILERSSTGTFSANQLLTLPFKNPLLITVFIGFIIAALQITIPEILFRPIQVVGQGAVPMVMFGFGAGLVGRKLMSQSRHRSIFAVVIKCVIMPLLALIIVTVLRLPPQEAMIAVLAAGLPTAANVYNFALKFDTGLEAARDTVTATTIVSPITIAIFALLMSTLLTG